MRVAVIGGGINGLCSAWALAEAGEEVTLYERDELMQATSCASTKLLHGGLRYLENGEFRLVYEALRERYWWLNQVPSLTQPLELVLPVYTNSQRSRWLLKLGLWLYDQLAGQYRVGQHRWHNALALSTFATELKTPNLLGGFTFSDGQMDDYRLGLWVAEQARRVGVQIQEHQQINRLYLDGRLETEIDMPRYDVILNVAGPWAESLLQQSGIVSRYQLDLVRGSHILFNEPIQRGYLLQVPNEPRIFFVLPYQGKTLVGTTEVRQSLEQPIQCSEAEADYLVKAYNAYFVNSKSPADISETFAGLRPLIRSAKEARRATRESAIDRQGRILTVYGGKWTTARALARSVIKQIRKVNIEI